MATSTARIVPEEDRQPTRLEHLLAVARQEFLAHGFQRTSVEGIGKAAGVSKQTIYRHFSDKSDILRAIVRQTSSLFESAVQSAPPGEDAMAVIARCTELVRRSFLGGDQVRLFRLSTSLATQFPEFSRTINGYFVGSLAPVADNIARLAETGAIAIADPFTAAAQIGVLAVEGTRYLMGFAAENNLPIAVPAIADLYLGGFLRRTSGPWPEIDPAIFSGLDPKTATLQTDLRGYLDGSAEFRLSEAGLQRLIAVARQHFFATGYGDSSLDDIGPTARVGRGTLYRWFGGKAGLFRVAMLHGAAEVGAVEIPEAAPDATLEDRLSDIAMAVSRALVSPTGTPLYRTVIAEADHFPDLARAVYVLTRARFASALVAILGETDAGRAMTAGQRLWAAMQFITLATDGNRYLSLDTRLTPDQRVALASRTANAFLYGHRKLG